MVEMAINIFHGKVYLPTNLATYRTVWQLFLLSNVETTITVILLLFWRILESIAGQVIGCVALITGQKFIQIIVVGTKAYFTVSLEGLRLKILT